MRIYNKKLFWSGAFMMVLGLINLITSIMTKALDISYIFLIAALMIMGFASIMRSTSRRRAREDKREELDERNRLIELKSKSKSFQLTHSISFIAMLTFIIMGKMSGYEGFLAVGVGLAFSLVISMFTEFFTYMYYESKN